MARKQEWKERVVMLSAVNPGNRSIGEDVTMRIGKSCTNAQAFERRSSSVGGLNQRTKPTAATQGGDSREPTFS